MGEILKDTETPFENDDGKNRFYGIEELEALAEDYKFIKRDINVVIEDLVKKLMAKYEE